MMIINLISQYKFGLNLFKFFSDMMYDFEKERCTWKKDYLLSNNLSGLLKQVLIDNGLYNY